MDVVIPVLIAVAVLVAIAWSLWGRDRRKVGGITPRNRPSARSGSAHDTADVEDREGFARETDQRGVR